MSKTGVSQKMEPDVIRALDQKVILLKAKNRSVLISHYIKDGLNGTVTKFAGPYALPVNQSTTKKMAKTAKKAAKAVKKAAPKKAAAKKATAKKSATGGVKRK